MFIVTSVKKSFQKLFLQKYSLYVKIFSLKIFLFFFSCFFLILSFFSFTFIFDAVSVYYFKKKIVFLEHKQKKDEFRLKNNYVFLSSFLEQQFSYYNVDFKNRKNKQESLSNKSLPQLSSSSVLGIGGKEIKITERQKKSLLNTKIVKKNKNLTINESFFEMIHLFEKEQKYLSEKSDLFQKNSSYFIRKYEDILLYFPTTMPFVAHPDKRDKNKLSIRKENSFFELLAYRHGNLEDKILLISPSKGIVRKIIKQKEFFQIKIEHLLGIFSVFSGNFEIKDLDVNSEIEKNQLIAIVPNGNKVIYKIIVGTKLENPKNFIIH